MSYESKYKREDIDELFEAILTLRDQEDCYRFFEDICNIPHISYHEKELSDYCVAFAKERNLYYEQDELGNVIIIGEATPGYEDVEPIIIQGHLDMVGDKVPECDIDMEKESIDFNYRGVLFYEEEKQKMIEM